ncbi:protein TIC 56, chloroplastic [Artemisia annua]|uniref:Protein TIC 56, chloroplastic n=1 Tax=Artemisia annua TaxID=35608 RepID=A0A2U1NQV4_ARTAN|nr:protein TIC 56, chloroplastic [Artemisia annua]
MAIDSLIKAIPGLRPWEVLNVEQAMDQITYSGQWYREPLGAFTTGTIHMPTVVEETRETEMQEMETTAPQDEPTLTPAPQEAYADPEDKTVAHASKKAKIDGAVA